MKRKKFLALALAGVMTAVTLTACAPLDALYDWFFGGGSGSASRGNGVNLVESPELKGQIVDYFWPDGADVSTDKSRTALEEVVGKLNAATMMDADKNALNAEGQKALNEVAKSQLLLNSGMCIDVMKWSPTSAAAAADAAPAIPDSARNLYWALYARGDGSTFGKDGAVVEPGQPPVSDQPTYTSELVSYSTAKMRINYYKRDNKVDLFVGTFTKDGETYLAMVMLWNSMV